MAEKKITVSSPFVHKNRFYNNKSDYLGKCGINRLYNLFYTIFKEAFIILFSQKQRFLDFFEDNSQWIKSSSVFSKKHDPVITWIGHSSFLIQIANLNILTDPVFGDITFLFKRIFRPGVSIEKLPHIDYLLISHNHRDHMDTSSLKLLNRIYPYIKILVPKGDKKWFVSRGFTRVAEFEWWGSHAVDASDSNIKFTFLPAYHWSGRNLFDSNESLWGSWMIEAAGYKVYFGGDTAYWDHFKDIGRYFGEIDVALLPIGPCTPRRWMKKSHMSSMDAGRALIDLGAKYMVPMHWGTFYFGCDRFDTPLNKLISWWEENKNVLGDKKLMMLAIGEQLKIDKTILPYQPVYTRDLSL